ETVPCWRPATITPHQQGGALITEQTVTIWVSVNLSSPLSLRKNLVVLALYQYSRPSPLSEADNIANPRGGVAPWTVEGWTSALREFAVKAYYTTWRVCSVWLVLCALTVSCSLKDTSPPLGEYL
ncbi:hypothetical protein J6590_079538, partial [Homalodisca vitripennis]